MSEWLTKANELALKPGNAFPQLRAAMEETNLNLNDASLFLHFCKEKYPEGAVLEALRAQNIEKTRPNMSDLLGNAGTLAKLLQWLDQVTAIQALDLVNNRSSIVFRMGNSNTISAIKDGAHAKRWELFTLLRTFSALEKIFGEQLVLQAITTDCVPKDFFALKTFLTNASGLLNECNQNVSGVFELLQACNGDVTQARQFLYEHQEARIQQVRGPPPAYNDIFPEYQRYQAIK